MPDNTALNLASTAGDLIATDELTTINGVAATAGLKVQRVKVGFGTDNLLRDVDAANPLPVTVGNFPATQSTHSAQVGGVAIAVGSGISGAGVPRVVLATDVPLPALSEMRSATLHVTATAAANTAVTATLPAVAGMFHYITNIHLMRNATAALAGTATLIHASANLPGNPAWSVGNAMVAGGTQLDVNYTATTPLRSALANTATTVTMPAAGAAVLNRINISYFTAA